MLPSKQNCKRMIQYVRKVREELATSRVDIQRENELEEVEEFLNAAFKKLPNEESFPKPKKA
jgi:hypothetical protein